MKLFKSTTAIAIAALLMSGATAQGVTRNLSAVASGDWNDDDAVWKIGGVGDFVVAPDSDDNATILTGVTVTVDKFATLGVAEAATLTVDASGILTMEHDGQLELGTALTITGTFQFDDQTEGTIPILRAASNLVISGDIVTVSGANEGGKIEMDASQSVRLSSGTISSQYGPIVVTADFENDGTMTANGGAAGYDITFTGAIASGSTGLFQVTATNSDMIFNHSSAVCLDDGGSPAAGADFVVSAGIMQFKQDLSTIGDLTFTGGKIIADASMTYTAGLSDCP